MVIVYAKLRIVLFHLSLMTSSCTHYILISVQKEQTLKFAKVLIDPYSGFMNRRERETESTSNLIQQKKTAAKDV